MGLSVASGRIIMTDGSGNTRFDTTEGLFIPLTYLSGSVNIPAETAENININVSDTRINIDTTTVLDSCHPDADTVRGAFKVETVSGSGQGVSGLGWFNAGGTYCHVFRGTPDTTGGPPTVLGGNRMPGSAALYTFKCGGGDLSFTKRIRLVAPYNTGTETLTLNEINIYYELFCGKFV